ncbi:phosphatase [Vibrio sp. SS-MA-C1-2]|uniref:phosphatase n=1 Tax=Vibrio sp. SS-MA-C1-2 TaxID=2908646 RepID=UPI001F47530D|nr:phosphatase [Vibrio sp. SS-MA-C1-2]UJF18306.1 phosphatase [Vibrio sp. SS-MA-C1-2]
MKIAVDTHTHTYASGHAYSTIIENAKSAKEHGLAMFCTTDHSESMPGAPHFWFFSNQRVLPRFIEGVAIIRGVESNIMNIEGEIDIPERLDDELDWVIASFHEPVFRPSTKDIHTEALLNVIKSGRVDALGHLGNPNFDFDFETVIQCAKEHHVAIEINNTSLGGKSRVGSVERCYEIAKVAKQIGAYVTTGSDAHFCSYIGKFERVETLLEKVEMPVEQIITHTPGQFVQFLLLRGRQRIEELACYY